MIEQILKTVIFVLVTFIGLFVLRTLYLCVADRFSLFPNGALFKRQENQYDYLTNDVILEAKELFAKVENGELKKESLGNEALPIDGRQTSISYQTMLDSPKRIEMLKSLKEKAYYEEY